MFKTRQEFWDKFKDFSINNRTKKPLDLHLRTDIFKRINGLPISGVLKAVVFTFYCFIKLSDAKGYRFKISVIKKLWGYSQGNKTLDTLVKKNGLMDSEGFTSTHTDGVDDFGRDKLELTGTKIQYKVIEYDVEKGKPFFKVYTAPLLGCMLLNKDLGVKGFYIYSFICYQCQLKGIDFNYDWANVAISYIATGTGLSETTVKNYLAQLLKYKMIKVKKDFNSKSLPRYKDLNKYLVNPDLPKSFYEDLVVPKISLNNHYSNTQPQKTWDFESYNNDSKKTEDGLEIAPFDL